MGAALRGQTEAKSAHGFISSPDFAQSDILQTLKGLSSPFLSHSQAPLWEPNPTPGPRVLLSPLLATAETHTPGTQVTGWAVTGIGPRLTISTQIFTVGKALLVLTISWMLKTRPSLSIVGILVLGPPPPDGPQFGM